MSVITALTAQNTTGVESIMEVPPEFVARQLTAVLTDIQVDAAKTGMLLTTGIVEVVAQKIRQYHIRNLVIDPVIASTSGTSLLSDEATGTVCRTLLQLPLVFILSIRAARVLPRTTTTA